MKLLCLLGIHMSTTNETFRAGNLIDSKGMNIGCFKVYEVTCTCCGRQWLRRVNSPVQ